MNYPTLFIALLPDLIVLISIFAALGVDYALLRGDTLANRSRAAANIACAGLLAGLAVVIAQIQWIAPLSLGHDQIVLDSLSLSAKAALFGLAAIVCVFSAGDAPNAHVSEYYALLLLSTLGAGFLVCTENILLLFVALELMSLSLYALTGFNKNSLSSAEAAIKYFAFGAVSSAFLLFGLSYFYGIVQTLSLQNAALAIGSLPAIPPLLRIALLLILTGLGFKIAMAPFHLWAPDTYQHAPAPVAGWIASGSKIAGFFVLAKFLRPFFLTPSTQAIWTGALMLGAALSLVVGNLGALRQTNLKRLLAYSAIGHAGYMILGLLAASNEGLTALFFYAGIYALANLGAFGVINLACDRLGASGEISDLAGLWKRKPLLAILTAFFFLSLAGIPPLAGFVGKFYLFFAAIDSQPQVIHWYQGYYWLVGLALLFSAISLYYYLQVLKSCFVADPHASAHTLRISRVEWVCLSLLALLILAGGLFPGPVFDFIRSALGQ